MDIRVRLFIFALVVVLACGCGPAAQPPTPVPGLAPPRSDDVIQPARPTTPPTEPQAPVSVPTLPPGPEPSDQLQGRLLFSRGGDLWIWEQQGGRRLTNQGDLHQPAWSPDGAQIVAVQRAQNYSDLVLLSPSGGAPRRLTRNGRSTGDSFERVASSIWAWYPAWAPNGREIVYASQFGPPYGGPPAAEYRMVLYKLPATGGERQQIFGADEGHVGRVAYAPDGQALVFEFTPAGEGAPQLLRYQPGREPTSIPNVPDRSYDPAFSPNGRWLAFAGRTNGMTDIFVAPNEGGAPVRISALGAARAPAWAPDGRQIAFLAVAPGARRFDLWVVAVVEEDGTLRAGQPVRLTEDAAIDADSGLSWGK